MSDILSGSINGVFIQPDGGTTTGVDTSSFTWGAGVSSLPLPNSFIFTPITFSITPNQAFSLGSLNYFNGSTTNSAKSVLLDISVTSDQLNSGEANKLAYKFSMNNTPNISDDPVGSADYVDLSGGNSGGTLQFNVGNNSYALKILGFGVIDSATNNLNLIPEFHVLEQASDSAQLIAKFVNIDSQVLDGTATNDSLEGGVGNDELLGWRGDDILKGNEGNDLLAGGLGRDSLFGGVGDDVLDGGAGRDILTGESGQDIFRIANVFTVDKITDFSVVDDTVELQNSLFASFENIGMLSPDMFRTGYGITKAADSNDYLIYNTSTGVLSYDDDGNGKDASAVQIAVVGTTTHPALTNADFVVV